MTPRRTPKPQSPPPPITEAVDGGFGILRQFMAEALQFDRETYARTAVLTTRLEFLTDQVDHLMSVVEHGDTVPSLVIQSCTAILRIIHSAPKPATRPSLPHHLRGHGHGTHPLVLPTLGR